ncbi:hypothetical protein ACLOJK_004852 [Asimina triloba]
MPLPDLKGTPIEDEDGEVRLAREKMASLICSAAMRTGLRPQRIYDHIIVVNRFNGSDHPSRASLVVGLPEMEKTPCCCLDGVDAVSFSLSSPNLEEVDAAVILPGTNREITAGGEGRRCRRRSPLPKKVAGWQSWLPSLVEPMEHHNRCSSSARILAYL